jgi:hypothetical protein
VEPYDSSELGSPTRCQENCKKVLKNIKFNLNKREILRPKLQVDSKVSSKPLSKNPNQILVSSKYQAIFFQENLSNLKSKEVPHDRPLNSDEDFNSIVMLNPKSIIKSSALIHQNNGINEKLDAISTSFTNNASTNSVYLLQIYSFP